MSTKSLIVAGGIVLILLAVSNFITWRVTKNIVTDDVIATLTTDSTAVDTVLTVEYDTVYIYFPYYAEAQIDTVYESLVFSTQIDTSVVINEDTVVVLKQDISFAPSFITDGGGNEWAVYTKGDFKILTDLELRPVEKLVEVTKREFRTVPKEVPVSKFPNTFMTGFVSGLLIAIILLIFLP